MSLEEQRQRQDSETLRVQRESLEQMQTSTGGGKTLLFIYLFCCIFTVASVGEGGGVLAQAGSSELPVNEVSSYFIIVTLLISVYRESPDLEVFL